MEDEKERNDYREVFEVIFKESYLINWVKIYFFKRDVCDSLNPNLVLVRNMQQ